MRTALLTLLVLLPLAAADPMAAPATIPDEQAFALAVIPDLRATLGRIEACAQVLAPGSLPPGQLATRLGTMLGDPTLAALGAGPVVAVLGPGGAAPSAAFIVPTSDAPALVAAAGRLRQQAEAVGDLVVVGRRAADVALGRRIAAVYAQITADPVRGDMRLMLAPARVVAAYRPVIAGGVAMMQAQMARDPQAAPMAKILGLEVAALLAAADEIEVMQADLRLDGTVVRADARLRAASGSGLADALVAPQAAGDAAERMGPEVGYVMLAGRLPNQALITWMATVAERLAQTPEHRDSIDPAIPALLREFAAAIGDGVAMRVRGTSEAPMRIDGVNLARDAAAFAGLQRRMIDLVFGDNAIGRLYRQMGFSATIEEAVREVGGASVTRFHYAIDPAQPQAEQLQRLMPDMEMAALADRVVFAQAPADLDRLVTGPAEPLRTVAATVLGAGRDGYLDVHVGRCLAAMLVHNPMLPERLKQAMVALPARDPITASWRTAGGAAQVEAAIPLIPFADITGAFRAAFGGPAPQPVENQVF